MRLSLPVYVVKDTRNESVIYRFQPLFFSGLHVSHQRLQRGMERFTREVRKHLEQVGKSQDQRILAGWLYAPPLRHTVLDLALDLRRSMARCRYLFVTCETAAGYVAFSPSLPTLWFDLARPEELHARATAVLTQYFRDEERQYGEDAGMPADFTIHGSAWVTHVEVEIEPRQSLNADESSFLELIGAGEDVDGEEELDRVGRCLDGQYPDDLDRMVGNTELVEELERHLQGRDRRPLLLVGPSQVGKTALVHEVVWRRCAARRRQATNRRQVWLLSPQRLIAGMSYVGQWENRLLAILDEAKRRKHVLYVDDLLGLFKAGVTAQSTVSIGHLLKSSLERREVRLLGEITPEGWRRLREVDRGFAELFHVIHLREPSRDDTWRILIAVQRRLEDRHGCRFGVEALPMVVELQQRYMRSLAFPGKAAGFMEQLATKLRDQPVSRADVLATFHEKSGLPLSFLDRRERLRRSDVLAHLKQRIIGQDRVLEILADVVSIGRARLNDPSRPLASLLFLGPTGVGKTECAKALAAFLYGSEERLLRFDMNEFTTPIGVARLSGTFVEPEGLLTSAVRRQPFAVILLDEIEKAHADVHDLLLQVMGEGRLSDALGRTTDFANTIVIMTSNLGVRQAASPLGFDTPAQSQDSIFVEAVEKFFRPEFVNRIDHIAPFQRLGREAIGRIAELLVQEVFAREGLARRLCMLRIEPAAREQLIDEGYHPLLGARALRRTIERRMTRPIAARLARLHTAPPMIVRIHADDPAGLGVELQVLETAAADPEMVATAPIEPTGEIMQRLVETLELLEEDLAAWEPDGAVSDVDMEGTAYRYFLGRDLLQQLRYRYGRLKDAPTPHLRPPGQTIHAATDWSADLGDWLNQDIWRVALLESADGASPRARVADPLRLLLIDHAYLGLLAEGDPALDAGARTLLIQPVDPQFMETAEKLAALYRETFTEQFGSQVELFHESKEVRLLISGPGAAALAAGEAGLHIFRATGRPLVPLRVSVNLIESQQVIRLYDEHDLSFDLRHGLFVEGLPVPWHMRMLMAGALKLPEAWFQEATDD